MANLKKNVRLIGLLPLLFVGGFGCGGASTPTPLDGKFPIYNTTWAGTFLQISGAQTGVINLSVDANGNVSGQWQDFNGLPYTLSGTATTHGSMKGVFLNSSGGPNGTFSGGVTTLGGTFISTATATGTITLTVSGALSVYSVTMSYNGSPQFSHQRH